MKKFCKHYNSMGISPLRTCKILGSRLYIFGLIAVQSSTQTSIQDLTNGIIRTDLFASGEEGTERYNVASDNENSAASKWFNSANSSLAAPNFFAVNFSTSRQVTGYLTSARDDFQGRDSRDWQIEASNNDSEWRYIYPNRFITMAGKSALDFICKPAQIFQSCTTLIESPVSQNKITFAQNGTFSKQSSRPCDNSYFRIHSTRSGFKWIASNPALWTNQDFTNPQNTIYNFTNACSAPYGMMAGESNYTTNYLGRLFPLADSQNTPDPQGLFTSFGTSLLNTLNGGRRKTYGSTIGDLLGRFLVVNGVGKDKAVCQQRNLTPEGDISYMFSMNARNANAFHQGISTTVIIPYLLLDGSSSITDQGSLTVAQASGYDQDSPGSPWDEVFVSIVPPANGVYSLEIRCPSGNRFGNDFYIAC